MNDLIFCKWRHNTQTSTARTVSVIKMIFLSFALFVCCTWCTNAAVSVFVIDSYTCKPSTGGLLGCELKGPGMYTTTSPENVRGFDTIVFRRFFNIGEIRFQIAPELRVVEIQSGDVECWRFHVPTNVRVLIATKLCDLVSVYFWVFFYIFIIMVEKYYYMSHSNNSNYA